MKPPKRTKRRGETNPFDDDPLPGQVQPGKAYRGETRDELPPPQINEPEIIPASINSEDGINLADQIRDLPPEAAAARLAELEKEAAKRAMFDPVWNGVRIGQSWPFAPRRPEVAVTDLQPIAGVRVVFFVRYLDPKQTTDRLPLADFLRRFQ